MTGAKFTPNPQLQKIMQRAGRAGVFAVAIGLQKAIKGKLNLASSNQGRTPSPAGQPPAKMTGTLGRSIQIDSTDPDKLRVGTNMVYAKIQEFGGVIKPKKARSLIVPVNDEARKYLRMNPKGPSGDKTFNVVRGKDRKMYLVKTKLVGRGKKKRLVNDAVFALRRSVRLPARPYMKPALFDYQTKASTDFARGFRTGLRGGAA